MLAICEPRAQSSRGRLAYRQPLLTHSHTVTGGLAQLRYQSRAKYIQHSYYILETIYICTGEFFLRTYEEINYIVSFSLMSQDIYTIVDINYRAWQSREYKS